MKLVLMDSNILLRGAQSSHPQYQVAIDAQIELRKRGAIPCLVAQNLIEFRAVATRPAGVNGLGMTQAAADADIARFKSLYPLFTDEPAILTEWERLVRLYGSGNAWFAFTDLKVSEITMLASWQP